MGEKVLGFLGNMQKAHAQTAHLVLLTHEPTAERTKRAGFVNANKPTQL